MSADNNKTSGEFNGLDEITLSELGDLYCGQSPSVADVNTEGKGILYVTGPEQWNGIEIEETKWTEYPKRIAPNKSIFITVKGAGVGKMFPGTECAIDRDVYAFKPSGLLNFKYVYLAIQEGVNEIVLFAKGDIPGISKNHIIDHKIYLPNRKTQDLVVAKIEEHFSELDKGIESLKTAREQLKVYRQALLKHAFEGKLTEQWRKDNTGKLETAEQLLERIKHEREARYQQQLEEWKAAVKKWEESGKNGKKPPKPRNLPTVKPENEGKPIEGLPESWHCLKLLDIVLSLGQGWSPKCNNFPAGKSEWGVIKTTAIQHLNYLEAENKQLPAELVPRPWLSIQQDDILITRAGPRKRVGVVCRVSETRDKLMLCDKAYRMQFPESEVSPAYIESLLNTEDFKRKIETLKTGISDSGVNITQPRLLGLYFPVPSIQEQLEIGKLLEERLSVIERNISDIGEALEKSEALRQSILKKAFSGQLVLQDPDDEPASVLLDRIAKEKEEAAARVKKAKAAKKRPKTTRTSTRKAS